MCLQMYLYSYIIGVGIRITHRWYLCLPFYWMTCVGFEGFVNRCMTIANDGVPITENRIFEKKTAHTRNNPDVRLYAYKKLRVEINR